MTADPAFQVLFATPPVYTENIHALTAFAPTSDTGGEGESDKLSFIAALDKVQVHSTPRPIGKEVTVHFVDGPDDPLAPVACYFLEANGVTEAVVVSAAERPRIVAGVASGIEVIRNYSEDYASAVESLVGSVLAVRDRGFVGVSLSSQIGTVALNPLSTWTDDDYAEALLHEGIHQAQFLDQMIHDWFALAHTELDRPETRVLSPIRRQNRPLNLTLDAACVATVLVDFLWWRGATKRASEMHRALRVSLEGIRERDRFLTSRGRAILDNLSAVSVASPVQAAA